jgi:hypothetical protein
MGAEQVYRAEELRANQLTQLLEVADPHSCRDASVPPLEPRRVPARVLDSGQVEEGARGAVERLQCVVELAGQDVSSGVVDLVQLPAPRHG